jgi:hypothetical protein
VLAGVIGIAQVESKRGDHGSDSTRAVTPRNAIPTETYARFYFGRGFVTATDHIKKTIISDAYRV